MTDEISMNRLKMLHTAIREQAIEAYTEACRITPVGVHPFITETYRSFERSNELYEQGRTKHGKIVTNAKAGQSIHNYSLAIDFVIQLLPSKKLVWEVDANWMKVVKCFKDKGFVWGGDWKSLKDYPHFEKSFGLGWRELLKKYEQKDFIPGTNFVRL